MKQPRLIMICLCMTLAVAAIAQVKSQKVASKISHVTLYRSQAQTVRAVEVPDVVGELALSVDDLPATIQPGSLFASSKDLKIRSVRYLTELIPERLPTDEIAKLDEALKKLTVTSATITTKRALLEKKKGFIASLERQYISKLGPTVAGKETKVAGFDFESIAKMTEFIFKQQEAITEETLKIDAETRKISDEQTVLRKKMAALTHGRSRSQRTAGSYRRRAIIYVAKTAPGKASLSLSYLVSNTGWSPAYNMRVAKKTDKLNMEYLAHIHQVTGEDWNGVALTLSTAIPNMNAEIPILAPMWVHLMQTERKGKRTVMAPSGPNPLAKNLKGQFAMAAEFQQKASPQVMQYNYEVNQMAWNRQNIEFRNGRDQLRSWRDGVRQIEHQVAVEYRIPGTVTLPSRNDNQMVQILNETLNCSLYYEAVPLLANYVSRGVEAKNTISQPLLAGRYSAFIDGQYVGTGSVPVTATGQTLALGFGIDTQLRCRRELDDKIADKSWGKRTETYKYKIYIDNYKDKPVKIRLLDRIPVTHQKELKITLITGRLSLSDDADYSEFDRPKGILRWDLEIPASSSGSKAVKFDYSFDMKFDSDMQISSLGTVIQKQILKDLNEMKMRRVK